MASDDKAFTGSIPAIYEKYLVPLIFEDYAKDLARRAATRLAQRAAEGAPQRVLEIACGTGVVTRALIAALAPAVEMIATDLNQAMLDQASTLATGRPIQFKQADVMGLPFPDQSVDVVVIQFGAMFFPDKAKAHSEARRVLRPGGALIFSVWDDLASNEFADACENGLRQFFPNDPPKFLSRAPYGYFDKKKIAADLAAGGFTATPEIATLAFRSRAKLASDPAVGFCQGSPLRGEIESRGALEHATDAAAAEVARRFGHGPVDGNIQAHIVTVER
jgi:SAM-dependent methyltransferase